MFAIRLNNNPFALHYLEAGPFWKGVCVFVGEGDPCVLSSILQKLVCKPSLIRF